jgi:hypothetical protein
MSSLFKPVISTLVVKVNAVLDSVPEMPLACKSLTVTSVRTVQLGGKPIP